MDDNGDGIGEDVEGRPGAVDAYVREENTRAVGDGYILWLEDGVIVRETARARAGVRATHACIGWD